MSHTGRLVCSVFLMALLSWDAAFASRQAPDLRQAPFPACPTEARIDSPIPGQALQGLVTIAVAAPAEALAVEIRFAYPDDATGAWFLIYEGRLPGSPPGAAPAPQAVPANWDTTLISDGTYNIQAIFTLADETQCALAGRGVRVRNYTPIETDTPPPRIEASSTSTEGAPRTPGPAGTQDGALATAGLETPTAPVNAGETGQPPSASTAAPGAVGLTLTPGPLSPPAAGAANPLEMDAAEVRAGIGRGALTAVGIFALLGVFAVTHRLRRRA